MAGFTGKAENCTYEPLTSVFDQLRRADVFIRPDRFPPREGTAHCTC